MYPPMKFYKELEFKEIECDGLKVESVRAYKVPGADNILFVDIHTTDIRAWLYGGGDGEGKFQIYQYKYCIQEIAINKTEIAVPELFGWFPEYHDY